MTDLTKWAREADEAIALAEQFPGNIHNHTVPVSYARRIKALIACVEALEMAAESLEVTAIWARDQTPFKGTADGIGYNAQQARAALADIARLAKNDR